MEIRTPTRLVRRIVDVATSTALPIVASVLRTTRGWIDQGQDYQFTASGQGWTNAIKRRDGDRHPAKGRRLNEVLRIGATFEFMHNTADGTAVTVTTEEILKTDEPATAYPSLHDAAGTLAIEDLTDNDGSYFLLGQLGSREPWMQDHAMQLLTDERLRAKHERLQIELGLETIQMRRRGPLLRHQPRARRQGSDGEPEAERRTGRRAHQSANADGGVNLKLRDGDATPTVEIRDGMAYFDDPASTEDERVQAEDESRFAAFQDQKGREELARLARAVPGDMVVTGLYGESLNQRHRNRDAQAVLRHTADVGRAALPEGFDGPIDTESDQGHALITAVGALADLECLYGSRTTGIELYEQLTQWDPDPYGYAQAKLGSEYVLASRADRRRHREADRTPLALPAQQLRPGDLPHHPGGLETGRSGHPTGPRHQPVHRGDAHGQQRADGCAERQPGHWGRSRQTATAHVLRYGKPWSQVENAKAFLRWVATHPKTLKTLAEVRTPDHEAAFTRHEERVNKLETEFITRVDQIGDRWAEMPTELLLRKAGINRRPWAALVNQDD